MKKLPKELYVFRENEGTQDEFLITHETAHDAADLSENRIVGRYVLEETLEVSAMVSIKPTKEGRA